MFEDIDWGTTAAAPTKTARIHLVHPENGKRGRIYSASESDPGCSTTRGPLCWDADPERKADLFRADGGQGCEYRPSPRDAPRTALESRARAAQQLTRPQASRACFDSRENRDGQLLASGGSTARNPGGC